MRGTFREVTPPLRRVKITTSPPLSRDISQDISLLSEFLENTPNKVKAAFKAVENFIKNNKEAISLNKSFSSIKSDLTFIKENLKNNKKESISSSSSGSSSSPSFSSSSPSFSYA